MEHPAPILRAIPCPEPMQPAPAKRFAKQAEDAGWDVRIGIAIGYRRVGRHDSDEFRPIRSVMVEARRDAGGLARAGQPYRDRIWATWVGPVDGSKMGFDTARRYPGGHKVGARDLAKEVSR